MNTDNPIIGKTFGYARVSTEAQNEDRQLIALRKAGVEEGKIYIDHKSGKDFKRPAWRKLVRQMKRGDLLVITSIDRMGRNYSDILSEWRTLVKTKGVWNYVTGSRSEALSEERESIIKEINKIK